MTAYSWTLATDFSGDWNASGSDWAPSGFPSESTNYSGDDISIVATTSLTLGNFLGGDTFHSLTLDDPNGTFTVGLGGGGINVDTVLTLNSGLISMIGGSVALGVGATAGTLVVNGTLLGGTDGGSNPTLISGAGSQMAALQGSGIITAESGLTDIGSSVSVSAGAGLTFQISDDGDGSLQSQLALEGAVNGGVVDFVGGSGLLVLDSTQVSPGGTALSGGTFGATIEGLTASTDFTNGIDILTNVATLSAQLSGINNDTLTIWDTATPGTGDSFTFNLSGLYGADTAMVQADTSGFGGFDVFLSSVCYAAGTAILTGDGEIAVESIQPGDQVMTLVDGAQVLQAVKWVGHRELVLGLHPNPDSIAPVRILKGALSENVPHRDLLLSPDHCLFIGGGLIPAKLLVNDMTIVRDLTMKVVSYHHIELEQHAVMIAEGVEAETYLDTGNRAFFSNAGLATLLHPELTINENLRCWEEDACAPLMVKPEAVRPVWQRIADRAVELGYTEPTFVTTMDAGIHLMVDGKAVRPVVASGQQISFMVPAEARSVRLVSRSTRPNALTPWLDDPRTLGVAIRSVTLRGKSGDSVMGADHPALTGGWHAPERSADGLMWRWSNGDAMLPVLSDGPCSVEIALSETSTYIESSRLAA
jgi:antigen 43